MQKPEIKTVSINDIRPYWRNPRNIEASVPAVMASITNYGYINPITVDENMTIITGHTRHLALKRLGYEEIEVMVITHLTPAKVKEFRIADNKTQENGSWNNDALVLELKEIGDLDDLQIFFPNEDIHAWVAQDNSVDWKDGLRQDDINKKSDTMQNRFKDDSEQRMSEYISLTCPHCGEDYEVKKGDVLKQMASR